MFTINYKGFYIHGYFDKKECRVNGMVCKSLHAAKILVTKKLIKAHDQAMCAIAL